MTVLMPYIPPTIYLLADNLDAALAAGEDLLTSSVVWTGGTDKSGEAIARARADQRALLEIMRTLEQVLLARVLKSRERAEDIGRRDPRFGTVARLYTAGTATLIEAVGEFGDTTAHDFNNGDGILAYLRSRGLIAGDQASPHDGETLAAGEEFLIARRIRLGTLLDLVAMFLDTLETHYDLFSDEAPTDELLPGEAPLSEEPRTTGAAVPLGDA